MLHTGSNMPSHPAGQPPIPCQYYGSDDHQPSMCP